MARNIDVYSAKETKLAYEAVKLSQEERERAFRDALNRYIAIYGVGDSSKSLEFEQHSQEKMYVPWQLRGKQILLDVQYPYELNRILREEVKEEVLDNINQAVYEKELEEKKKKEEEKKKEQETKENSAKTKTVDTDKVSRDLTVEGELTKEKTWFPYGTIVPAAALVALSLEARKERFTTKVSKTAQNVKTNAKDFSTSKLEALKQKRETYLKNLQRLNMARQKMGLSKICSNPVAKEVKKTSQDIYKMQGKIKSNNAKAAREMPKEIKEFLVAKREKEKDNEGYRH